MPRLLIRFSLVLIAASLWPAALRADEPSQLGSPPRPDANVPTTGGTASLSFAKSGAGIMILSGSNSYTGAGVATPGNGSSATFAGIIGGSWGVDTANTGSTTAAVTVNGGVLDVAGFATSGCNNMVMGFPGGATGPSIPSPTIPIPAGPVFYIIVEGAGLGDSVRSVPCTGKETVLSVVGAVNGISSVSSGKLWIARPTPGKPDKSTTLTVDWEAISQRGVETTNYKLMPGDRLVFAANPSTTQANLAARKNGPLERASGVVSLTTSVIAGLKSTPSAAPVLKELVERGFITDDEELRHVFFDAIRAGEEGAKADANGAKLQPKEQSNERRQEPKLSARPTTVCVSGATLTLTGTLQIDADEGKKPQAAKIAAIDAPHELALRPLPDYRLEPPDVIQIEMLKMVPLPPYRAAIFDVLKIHAETPPDHPIDNYYMVQADGTVNLGPVYESVHVAGMTIDELRKALNKSLRNWIREPAAHVELARVCGAQPVTGQYLIGPDGTVNLRAYGRVCLTGKTIAEARSAIEKQLATYLKSPELSLDVVAYNSKVYYVITQGAGLGDTVRRLPSTGKETVLDAISQINGLSQISSKNITLVRPMSAGKTIRLPIDWDGIAQRGETATNYQIYPGDRVCIAEDPLVTMTNEMTKKTSPVERLMGIVGLVTNTVNCIDAAANADEALKTLAQRGYLTNDEQLKQVILDAIRHRAAKDKAAGGKK